LNQEKTGNAGLRCDLNFIARQGITCSTGHREGAGQAMKKHSEDSVETPPPAKPQGEQERDNDAHRPDGSSGTEHDSTAQKTARQEPSKKH
jgi:hypothetical protein